MFPCLPITTIKNISRTMPCTRFISSISTASIGAVGLKTTNQRVDGVLRRLPNAASTPSSASSSSFKRSVHTSRQRVTLIDGDGIGPEVMEQCKRVLQAMELPFGFDEFSFSYQRPEVYNDKPEHILNAIVANRYCLSGHITPRKSVYLGTSLHVISKLDFFANVTYIQNYDGIKTRHSDVDIILVREQSEGEYHRLEHTVWSPGSGTAAEALKVISRDASFRIVKFAFDLAVKRGRKKVTLVHKANIMKQGDGMFLRTGQEVAKMYPDIQCEDMIIDNMCMQIVSKPQQFDVVVTTNLYGNILENVGAGLVGGVGLVPGEDWSHGQIMFGMGVRHDGSDIAGKGIANPTYMLLSASNMLKKMGYYRQSAALKFAVLEVLREGTTLTKDQKGQATTAQFVDAVLHKVEQSFTGI